MEEPTKRALEDVSHAYHQERMELDDRFTGSGGWNSSARVVQNYVIASKHFTVACEVVGKNFEEIAHQGTDTVEHLAQRGKDILREFWAKIEVEVEKTYVEPHKNSRMNPTWEEFAAWREREVELKVVKRLTELYHKTPSLDALRATTPANWKEIFASAADDDLHSIVNGGRTMGNQIIQGRASSELRRREAVAAEATLDRGEKHAEKLTTRNLVWGFLIAVVGAVVGAVATWVLTPACQ